MKQVAKDYRSGNTWGMSSYDFRKTSGRLPEALITSGGGASAEA